MLRKRSYSAPKVQSTSSALFDPENSKNLKDEPISGLKEKLQSMIGRFKNKNQKLNMKKKDTINQNPSDHKMYCDEISFQQQCSKHQNLKQKIDGITEKNVYKLMKEDEECALCCQEKQLAQFSQIFICHDKFCNQCLKNLCVTGVNSWKQIMCPKCSLCLKETDNLYCLMNEQQWKKYKKHQFIKSIQRSQNLRLCPNTNCQQGTIEVKSGKHGRCHKCENVYCLNCMLIKHAGQCNTSNEKIMRNKFRYQKCSQCLNYVEKFYGCPHMTCRCQHQFCYYCGSSWDNGNHRCMRIKIGSDYLITDKIANTCQCLKSKDSENDYGITGYLLNIPYGIGYSLLSILWLIWCLVNFALLLTLLIVGCFLIGYPFILKKCIECFHNNTKVKLLLLACIIFAPVAFVSIWIFSIFYILKQRSSKNFFEPCFGGYIFPVYRCALQ